MKPEQFSVILTVEQPQAETATTMELTADSHTNLLQVMHDANLPVRKACRNGGCGVCRCRLESGDIDYRQREPFALWEKDKDEGVILPCIAFAKTDLVLDGLSFDKTAKRR